MAVVAVRKSSIKGRHSNKQILPAPDGVMTPTQLAQKTSGLVNGEGMERKPGIGVKRRLMDSMKTEEHTPGPAKKAKAESVVPSNMAESFVNTAPKLEVLEDGEVPMEGVLYGSEVPPMSKPSGLHPPAGPPAMNASFTTVSLARSASTSEPKEQQGPTLLPPKKPPPSMFIKRKVKTAEWLNDQSLPD